MKKLISLTLALLMAVSFSVVAFAAEADDYLTEAEVKGKVDVLSGVKGTLYCGVEKNNELDIDTLLTDGIVSANDNADDNLENRIHLNYEVGQDVTVSFPGADQDFIYAVKFDGLDKVTVDSFVLYYAGQYDDNLKGRNIPTYHANTNIVILASTDNGASYKAIFESDCASAGGIGADEEYSLSDFEETDEGANYQFILTEITLDAPVTGITNLVYCAPDVRPNGGDWPARISEFSAYAPAAAAATEAPKATEAPAAATEAPAEPGKAPNGFVNASFDNIEINGKKNFDAGDGEASKKMQVVDGSKGDIAEVILRGWAGFDQAITSYGYRLNGQDVFVEGDTMTLTTEKEVCDVEKGGAENGLRFQVKVPTAELKGENTIVVIAKLADGTVVAIDNAFDSYVHGYATASPNTTFTFKGPDAPAATEAPAAATEAPKATDAPAAATEVPAPAKKGCGSTVACGAIAVLAACALVIRKKED